MGDVASSVMMTSAAAAVVGLELLVSHDKASVVFSELDVEIGVASLLAVSQAVDNDVLLVVDDAAV